MTLMALKKVTICGLDKEKEAILKGLQDLGCMHLVPLRPAPAERRSVPAGGRGRRANHRLPSGAGVGDVAAGDRRQAADADGHVLLPAHPRHRAPPERRDR